MHRELLFWEAQTFAVSSPGPRMQLEIGTGARIGSSFPAQRTAVARPEGFTAMSRGWFHLEVGTSLWLYR